MNLVFVNYCHPDTPHVCGVRVARFAQAMVRRGHRVVLVTRDLDGHPVAPPPAALAKLVANHDWNRVLHIAVAPRPSAFHRVIQDGTVLRFVRRPAIAAAYVLTGGLFGDWRRAGEAYGKALATHFHPDLAWGTFGNTDTWLLARSLARAAGAPWVMDIKDFWRVFIPSPLRRLLADRFVDAALLTALSHHHIEESTPFFAQEPVVVYSGLPDEFAVAAPAAPVDEFVLAVTGSVYGQANLRRLIAALKDWVSPGRRQRLVYAGGDHAAMAEAVSVLGPEWIVEIHRYLSLPELRRVILGASVNLYLRCSQGFQHKVLELLSAGRPVIAFPAEGLEAHELANATGGTLLSCDDEAALKAVLDRLVAGEDFPAATPEGIAQFTWDAQAARLEACFQQVLEARA